MFLGGQDYLSILCQANLLPILNFMSNKILFCSVICLNVSDVK